MMISGRLTYLRPITEEDFEGIYKATKDDEIKYMTGTTNTFTLEDIKRHYESKMKEIFFFIKVIGRGDNNALQEFQNLSEGE